METLSQMLEDYRNGERGLPSYDELMNIVTKIEYGVINAQRYLMLRDAELYGGALYVWDQRGEKHQECGQCIWGGELDIAIDAVKEPSC